MIKTELELVGRQRFVRGHILCLTEFDEALT